MPRDKTRKELIALNESAYREMNEWVKVGQPAGAVLTVYCECGYEACDDAIRLPCHEYEAVRENSIHFVVSPDHLTPDVECRVEARPAYWVIEKFESVADLVEATDPRRPRKSHPG